MVESTANVISPTVSQPKRTFPRASYLNSFIHNSFLLLYDGQGRDLNSARTMLGVSWHSFQRIHVNIFTKFIGLSCSSDIYPACLQQASSQPIQTRYVLRLPIPPPDHILSDITLLNSWRPIFRYRWIGIGSYFGVNSPPIKEAVPEQPLCLSCRLKQSGRFFTLNCVLGRSLLWL